MLLEEAVSICVTILITCYIFFHAMVNKTEKTGLSSIHVNYNIYSRSKFLLFPFLPYTSRNLI